MGRGQCDPVAMETPRLLERGCGLTEPDGIAREAKNTIRPAVGGDHSHDLRGHTMTLAADQHVGGGPRAPARRPQPDQAQGLVGPRRAGARTQIGGDQGMRGPCNNAARQRAMVLRVMMREGQLLRPVRRIIGVVHSEDKGGRGRSIAGDAVVHQGVRQPIDGCAVPLGLQPGARGGTRSVGLRLQGAPLQAEFEHGVTAEVMGVMRIRIP